MSSAVAAAFKMDLVANNDDEDNGVVEVDRRWRADITYRSSETPGGLLMETHYIEEMSEVHDIVESGHHWGTIAKMEIYLNREIAGQSGSGFTIEQAALL